MAQHRIGMGTKVRPDFCRLSAAMWLSVLVSLTAVSSGAASAVSVSVSTSTKPAPPKPPQLKLKLMRNSGPETLDIIAARGFKGELYLIRSRDLRYPISLYHIINPLADARRLEPVPVLMFHGLAADSAQLIGHSEHSRPRRPTPGQTVFSTRAKEDDNLAFLLSNNNYDVWLADARGTNLNNHKSAADLDLRQSQSYWNYTLDDQALKDLPAVVDFVLERTNAPKLHYIGFSESTFFAFALLSAEPAYQQKFASLIAMAPVAFVTHIQGTSLVGLLPALGVPDEINGNYMPQPIVDTLGVSVRQFCANPMIGAAICTPSLRGMAGAGKTDNSAEFFTTAFKSTSLKAVKQFMQLYVQQRFGMYDYGPLGNRRQYGSPRPPDYALERIKLPTIILVRGLNDFLSTPKDQARLIQNLGTPLYSDVVLPHFNHLDFLLSPTILQEVNAPILSALNQITRQLARAGQVSACLDWARARAEPLSAAQRLRPVDVARPERAHRHKEIRSQLAENVLDGMAESHRANMAMMGVPANSFATKGVEQTLNFLSGLSQATGAMSQRVNAMLTKPLLGH